MTYGFRETKPISLTALRFRDSPKVPIDEKHPQNPISPYGRTKLIVEQIFDDYEKATITITYRFLCGCKFSLLR